MMMNEIMTAPDPADPAEAAFARMQGEVALLRRAIEAMAAERATQEIPDYGVTLGQIAADLAETMTAVGAMAESPALRMTPKSLTTEIDAVAADVRRADHAALSAASAALTNATGDLGGWIESARQASVQNWRLIQVGVAGLVGGAILSASVPGAVAGLAPQSWGWPERLAALSLGGDLWNAGERMLAIADWVRWRAVEHAKHLADDNAPAITACATAAAKGGRPVRCQVMVGSEASPPPR
jgi:hypothetical protein